MSSLIDGLLFDAGLYSGRDDQMGGVPTTLVEFGPIDGQLYSLSDNVNTFVENIDDSGPESEMIQYSIVRDDGVVVVQRFQRGQIITISGWIEAADKQSFYELQDAFKKNLRYVNGYLYICKENIAPRRYLATLTSFKSLFASHAGNMITWSPFVAKFFCPNYGTDLAYTTNEQTFTVSSTNQEAYNSGSVETKPLAILTFNAANTVTAVTMLNTDTGETITITTAIVMGDVVEFDSERNQVRLNGTAIQYSGAFPNMKVGGNTFQFTVTATSFEVTSTIKWRNSYL